MKAHRLYGLYTRYKFIAQGIITRSIVRKLFNYLLSTLSPCILIVLVALDGRFLFKFTCPGCGDGKVLPISRIISARDG